MAPTDSPLPADPDHPDADPNYDPATAPSTAAGNVAEGTDDPDPLALARARVASLLTDHGPVTLEKDGTITTTLAGVPVSIIIDHA